MSQENQKAEQTEVLQLKADIYDLHKNYQQQLQQQSQILQVIVGKLGFDGEVSIDDVIAKIAELMPESEEEITEE